MSSGTKCILPKLMKTTTRTQYKTAAYIHTHEHIIPHTATMSTDTCIMDTHTHTRTYTHTHTDLHTNTHTHTHTHTHTGGIVVR